MSERNQFKILTDVQEPRGSIEWQKRTDFRPEIVGGKGTLSNISAAIRLLFLSRKCDIVILGGSRKATLFTFFSALWPGKKTPILMIDCLWYRPRNWFLLGLKRFQCRVMARVVNKFVVWASHEVRDYASVFHVPEQKFIYIPHHHTLEGYEFEVSDGDYIFSGGDGDRDYETLLKAVEGLGVKVIIATRLSNWNGNIPVPEYVKAFPTSHADFRKLMAGSKLVVVPMKKGLLHSGGQQTYLSAMAMGKPVIVADDKGAKDYIENGVNGFIVPAGDGKALREAIKMIVDNPEFGIRLGNKAKDTMEPYSTPLCMKRILQTAEEIVLREEES
jgi:glycosyltransferase involved in cell wall biosynthesis